MMKTPEELEAEGYDPLHKDRQRGLDTIYVVWNTWTGFTDESMRFATVREAHEWIDENEGDDYPDLYQIREEN